MIRNQNFWFSLVTFHLALFLHVSYVTGYLNNSVEESLFPKLPNFILNSNNEKCNNQSKIYLENLKNFTLWAYEIFDASEKSTSGQLSGNVYHFGDWDECFRSKAPFKTQYCLTKLFINGLKPSYPRDHFSIDYSPYESIVNKLYKKEDNSQVRRDLAFIGLCIPAACTTNDLQNNLNNYLRNQHTLLSNKNVSYSVEVSQNLCQIDDYFNFDTIDISFCILVLLLLFLVIFGTTADYIQISKQKQGKKQNSAIFKYLIPFSIKRNVNDLLKSDLKSPLNVLHGIKVISICMIILDHRLGTFTSGPVLNFNYIETEYKAGAAFAIFHGDLFVDSFFVLSGILVAYLLLEQFEKKVVNPFLIFLVRYVRLTPAYAFVIFFYASLFENTGSGPLWKLIIEPEAQDCRKNWWISLLFLSNYINDENMCMVHSWYLPCDFHYFIVATFTIRILKRNSKLGLSILTVFLILSMLIPLAITVIYERPATLLFYPDFLVAPKAHPDFQLTYTKSHTRASPYIIGLFAGYLYYELKGSSWKLRKFHSHLLLLSSTVLLIGGLGSGAVFYTPNHTYNVIEAGIYAGFHRIIWALGTVGLLITASHGHSTIIKSFLSSRPMIVLGKLVYGVYIVHMQFVLRSVAISKISKYLAIPDIISLVLGDICVAFIAAFFLYLIIELPFRKILKELFMSHIHKATGTFESSNVGNEDTSKKIINNQFESRL